MSVVGWKHQDTARLRLNCKILPVKKRLSPLKILVEVANNTDISSRYALSRFIKASCQQQIINMTLVILTWLVSQNRAGFCLGKLDAIVLVKQLLNNGNTT